MFLSGTLLNAATVLIGGLIGTRLGARLPERLRATVVRGLGLFTIALGLQGALQTRNVIILLFAILLGGLAGSALSLDARLRGIGDALQRRLAAKGGQVSEAFVTTSIVFCVGPLTFLGAIRNGLTGDPSLLWCYRQIVPHLRRNTIEILPAPHLARVERLERHAATF